MVKIASRIKFRGEKKSCSVSVIIDNPVNLLCEVQIDLNVSLVYTFVTACSTFTEGSHTLHQHFQGSKRKAIIQSGILRSEFSYRNRKGELTLSARQINFIRELVH